MQPPGGWSPAVLEEGLRSRMHLSPVVVVSVLALWVLAVEAITDIASNHLLHIPPVMAGALHAIMLLSGVVPGLYFFVFRPSARYILQRKQLEDELTEARDLLESQVLQRTAELLTANRTLENKMDELRSAEQALRDSEERYRTLFMLAGDAFLTTLGPERRIVDANEAALRMLGFSEQELMGRPGRSLAAPEVQDETAQAWRRQVESAGSFLLETVWVRKDGSRVPVEISGKSFTLGGKIYFQLIGRDITERRRAAEALERSEKRFRRLAENAQDVIYRYDLPPGKGLSYISPAISRLSGYSPDEYYADAGLFLKVLGALDIGLPAGNSGSGSNQRTQTIPLLHKNGSAVWVDIREVIIYEGEGAVAIEGIARDVTERKHLEERLLRAQRLEMAGLVAGQVAHDLNNLLGPMLGFPELIKQRLPAGHPAIRYCDAMLEVAPQMAEVSENMLTLGRRGQLHREMIGLNGLVRQSLVQAMELPATMTVNLDLDTHLLPVNGSRSQLLRVVSNLLSNAREAISDNGVISLRTRNGHVSQPLGRYCEIEAGEYAVIEVCDTGPGIPTEIMDKIFDPFFTTKRPDRRCGSGLGLSIVQCIVNDHGGYVDVESTPGAGTKFRVYLPVCCEALHHVEAQEIPDGQGRAGLDGVAW